MKTHFMGKDVFLQNACRIWDVNLQSWRTHALYVNPTVRRYYKPRVMAAKQRYPKENSGGARGDRGSPEKMKAQ